MNLAAQFVLRAVALGLMAGAAPRLAAQFSADSQTAPVDTMPEVPQPDIVRPPDRVTFFPAPTPVFDDPIVGRVGGGSRIRFNGREFVAPEELADYVDASFYPALGTRLYEKNLPDPLARRLAAYRDRRDALVNELLNELVTVGAADAATRESQLREFAQGQTPRIAALENEAEGLRHALVAADGFFGRGTDWNADRKWRLGVMPTGGRGGFDETAEFQVIRAAAYFQDGLGIEQRGLLREIALSERDKLRAARHMRPVRDPLTIFFSPETARLTLPSDLPPELRAKFGAYSGGKDALKRELRDAIVGLDGSSDTRRTKALRELSDRQWPRLVALENLADEIRRGLAALPPPPLPPLPPALPADLKERIEAYVSGRRALEQERQRNLSAAIEKNRPMNPDRFEAVRRDDESFRLENAPRYEALARDGQSISRDLTAFARTQIDPATGKPFDPQALLRRINVSDRAFDKIGLEQAVYRDYRTAMLEPGLSPEQRRLLFGRALVELAQPLASGTKMPNGTLVPATPL